MTKNYPARRNIFILLSLLCLILIIFINTSIPRGPEKHQQLSIAVDINKLANNPYLFLIGILVIIYLAIILLGLFNFIRFLIFNLRKPFFTFSKQNKSLPLSQETSSKLIFFILFLTLLVYFSLWLMIIFKLKINLVSASLFYNFVIEVSVILLTIKYLKSSYLDFKLSIKRAADATRKYLIILPVLIVIVLINNFVLERIGIDTTTNPAVELFLKIKSMSLLSFFILQIVLFGPVAEELFFRGFVYKLIRKKYGFFLSALSSSLLFAALHRSSQDLLPLTTISISLCYVYEKTNNIASPIFFHIIHNSLSVSLLLLIKIII